MANAAPTHFASCTYSSPVGALTLAADEGGLRGLWLEGQKYFGRTLDAPLRDEPDNPHLAAARQWLGGYFAGDNPDVSTLKLTPHGTEFQQVIWELLLEIPQGETRTYGDLAKEAALRLSKSRTSALAVGGAVGHNPISIIIPCHRAVGANGSLTGYAGGIPKKLWLLQHEGVDTNGFFIPAKSTAP